jgi:hypothetical protein
LTSCIGWLLDVSIEKDHAVLSIKTEEDGQILKLRDSYHPGFYVLSRNESDGLHLFQILSREEEIAVRWGRKQVYKVAYNQIISTNVTRIGMLKFAKNQLYLSRKNVLYNLWMLMKYRKSRLK